MTPRAEHEARERQEDELRSLGRELREVVSPAPWAKLDEEQRAEALERAFALARQRMGVQRETPVLSMSDPKERGYEEATGEIKIPRDDSLSFRRRTRLVLSVMRCATRGSGM